MDVDGLNKAIHLPGGMNVPRNGFREGQIWMQTTLP